ncbi:hypothetical protein Tco_1344693 [Tanacetum coccineum]
MRCHAPIFTTTPPLPPPSSSSSSHHHRHHHCHHVHPTTIIITHHQTPPPPSQHHKKGAFGFIKNQQGCVGLAEHQEMLGMSIEGYGGVAMQGGRLWGVQLLWSDKEVMRLTWWPREVKEVLGCLLGDMVVRS